jgi:hypothetical protein
MDQPRAWIDNERFRRRPGMLSGHWRVPRRPPGMAACRRELAAPAHAGGQFIITVKRF